MVSIVPSLLFGIVVFVTLGSLMFFLGFQLWGIIKTAPFVPISNEHLATIMENFPAIEGKRFVDLGAGNGKLVVALARKGAIVHGYELNPLLVMWAKLATYKARLHKSTAIYWQNFWQCDLAAYDGIVVYGFPGLLAKLEEKIRKEAKKGTIIISVRFALPTFKPTKTMNSVYFYIT